MPGEYGSEFDADCAVRAPGGPLLAQVLPGATLWGSGRAALRALVRAKRWRRVWVPSYICAEVLGALDETRVAFYVDHPLRVPAGLPEETGPDEAVLRVNYFGLRGAEEAARSRGEVIEDHTHDPVGPWARASRAPYAFASLRKTYPSADGGALWSPAGRDVPAAIETTAAHAAAAGARLRAMALKAEYLRGAPVAKDGYRALFAAGEKRIGTLSGPDAETRGLLARVSPVALAAARRAAWEKLADATPWTVRPRGDPFALVLDLGAEAARDRVLRALVAEQVFPSVLWPLSWWKADREARAVSKRLLTVSTDFRYPDDVVHEVAVLLRSLA